MGNSVIFQTALQEPPQENEIAFAAAAEVSWLRDGRPLTVLVSATINMHLIDSLEKIAYYLLREFSVTISRPA